MRLLVFSALASAVAFSRTTTIVEGGLLGGDEDENGCRASAGQAWCENRGECVRPFDLDDFEAECNACGEVMCMMFCEHGFSQNANGCDICECADAPEEPIVGDDEDENGCIGSAGYLYCAKLDACHRPFELLGEDEEWADVCDVEMLGGDEDENGCKSSAGQAWCENRGECVRPFDLDDFETECNACGEVMCMMFCANGYKQNANGCDICECAEEPMLGGDQDENGCYTSAGYQHCPKLDTCIRPWELLLEGKNFDDECELDEPILGADEDEYGCKSSAGQVWCENWGQCVRPFDMDDFEAQCNECGNVMCMMWCEHGFMTNANGCDICKCANDPSVCGSKQKECANKCTNGYADDDQGCMTCDCICDAVECSEMCESYRLDSNGCQTCECEEPEEPEVPLPNCVNLEWAAIFGDSLRYYCSTIAECETLCTCPEGTAMQILEDDEERSFAVCAILDIAEPEFCENSPEQLCRMLCPEPPACGEGECVMRNDRCCDLSCQPVAEKPKKPAAEPGFCENSPEQLCRMLCPEPPACGEGECLMRTGSCCDVNCQPVSGMERMTYKAYKKACRNVEDGDEASCEEIGCKYRKETCKAQKADEFKCGVITDETFCNHGGPEFCSWRAKKNGRGRCMGADVWE